jgi:hypothetical protein
MIGISNSDFPIDKPGFIPHRLGLNKQGNFVSSSKREGMLWAQPQAKQIRGNCLCSRAELACPDGAPQY